MALHPAGIVTDQSAAAAGAFNRVELNPVGVIQLTEVGISLNAAPNSTAVPVSHRLKRTTAVGTGTAGTVAKLRKDLAAALGTTALVENSADGALADQLHTWFVPVVSGIIWVAAPNREPDCQAAEFLGVQNQAALPAGVAGEYYLVFEEWSPVCGRHGFATRTVRLASWLSCADSMTLGLGPKESRSSLLPNGSRGCQGS